MRVQEEQGSLVEEGWQGIFRRVEGSPLWFQLLVFPVLAPAIVGAVMAGRCPRTASVSVIILAVVYGFAVRGGLMGWGMLGRSVVILYVSFVVPMYIGMVEYHVKRLYSWWSGNRENSEENPEA